MKRVDLLEKLELISPALSANALIPVLQNIWFRGDRVMAFNDAIAISTPLETNFQGSVPGKILLDLLKASKARDVELILEKDNLLIKAASSRFRLGVLPPDSFVFDMPEHSKDTFGPSTPFFEAIESCMRSVSTDTSIPDQLGITLIPNPTTLQMFATNNATISMAEIELPTKMKERVILSESFCKQMLSLRKEKTGSRLEINPEYSLFTVGDTVLFGRLIESGNPLDFPGIIEHHMPSGYDKHLVSIPTKLQFILDRAVIITDSTAADRKPTLITVKERGKMLFYSKSDRGEVHDNMQIEDMHPEVSVRVEAKLVKQGYGSFDKWLVTKDAVLMVKDQLLYLIGVTS